MALVVLLRGANLGKRRFSPLALADALADIGLASIGAAGTFVVTKRVAEATLRARVQAELPWKDAEMVILAEKEVRQAMVVGAEVHAPEGTRKFGLALPQPPPADVGFPLEARSKDEKWAMRYEASAGRVVIGVRRRYDDTGSYSTRSIDQAIGSDRGTMRDWPTWERIANALDG